MRIAVLAPVAWRTPPRHYGPWELIAGLITEGLVERGHDVTLFATLDSVTRASLDGVLPRGYGDDASVDGRVWEALHVAHALDRSAEFDLVHNHLDWLPLAFANQWGAPLLTTVHGFSGAGILPAYRHAQTASPDRGRTAYVAISDADRSSELQYLATIHHGIDVASLPLSTHPAEDLVVFGRIHPDKGTAEAISIARAAGRRLVICGIVQDARYFAECVEPFVDGDAVTYLGSVGPDRKADVLGSAAVLLHPIDFDEPFGLSVVEAMACGTPVVAYRRGSMSEVVDEGVTGFLADDVPTAVAAVERAVALDRTSVRARAATRFSAGRMVDDYVRAYTRLLG